jgi:hypothetical protein
MVNKHIKKIKPKNGQLFRFKGTNPTPVLMENEPEYIEIVNINKELKTQAEKYKQEMQEAIKTKNKLLDRLGEIESILEEITKVGLLDYLAINLIKEGE